MRSQEHTDVAGIRTPPGRPLPRHRLLRRAAGPIRLDPCPARARVPRAVPRRAVQRPVRRLGRPALGAAPGRRRRDGSPAPRGPVRPRGGRAVHLRRALEVRRRRPAVRLPGLRPHGARRHAGAPRPLRGPQPDLRAHARGREGGRPRRRPAGARLDPAVRRGRDHGHGHPRAERDPGRARRIGRTGAIAPLPTPPRR